MTRNFCVVRKPSVKQTKKFEQMKARKQKERIARGATSFIDKCVAGCRLQWELVIDRLKLQHSFWGCPVKLKEDQQAIRHGNHKTTNQNFVFIYVIYTSVVAL